MYAGQVVETAPVDELFAAPRHPYTRGLLDATPRMDETVDDWTAIDGSPPDAKALPPGCAFAERCFRRGERCGEPPPVAHVGDRRTVRCWYPLASPAHGTAGR
jgi:oligopeptide/dipeptide ABC transporter ATP-binding protein